MNRFILLAFAGCCSFAATTIADDYLFRVDTIGYVDKPADEKDPEETLLHSIEVIARPESAFHGKVTIGMRTLSLAGELRHSDDGDFIVQFQHTESIDKRHTVVIENGRRKLRLETTTFGTIMKMALGACEIGGNECEISESGKPKLKSKLRYVLVLAKYDLPQQFNR